MNRKPCEYRPGDRVMLADQFTIGYVTRVVRPLPNRAWFAWVDITTGPNKAVDVITHYTQTDTLTRLEQEK